MNHLMDPAFDPDAEKFYVAVTEDLFGAQVLAQADLTANIEQTGVRGEATHSTLHRSC